MKLGLISLLALAGLGWIGAGCNQAPTPAAATNASSAASNGLPSSGTLPGLPTKAQPRLATMKLWVGAEELITELALTGIQQQTGMMFRTNMPENEAMLFPLPYPQRASFWMMNCPLPLSAAYIDSEGVIVEIRKLEPYNTNSVVADADNIRFVLETPQGWFDRHRVTTGMVIRTERGSLMDTFFRR